MTSETTRHHTAAAAAEALSAHPWIAGTDVTDDGGVRILVSADALATTRTHREAALGGLVREHLEHWTEVYDWTYRSAPTTDSVTVGSGDDLAGWRATDTGQPLPAAHMIEWVERTVELVLAQRPTRIVELGCGTGLLMRRLAPHVDSYIGTDVAGEVVERLAALNIAGTTFVNAAAHEMRGELVRDAIGATGAKPDCILLNSVTQCFPDVGYLAAVVLDALDSVSPGGSVIVGDVRHSGQLLDFAQWAEGADGVDGEVHTLEDRAVRRAESDSELCVDPATLAAIAAASGRRVSMLAYAKTLTDDSELTHYRFDAVYRVDGTEHADTVAATSWGDLDARTPDAVRSQIDSGPTLITGIPRSVRAAELRAALVGTDAAVLIDPTDTATFSVASPAYAGAIDVSEPPAVGIPHEPLGAFARTRMVDVARSHLRRVGIDRPGRMIVELPSGRGLDLVAALRRRENVDRAGRTALSGTAEPASDAALARVPGAVEALDRIALSALTNFFRTEAGVEAGVPSSVDDIARKLRAAERHRWILQRWIEVLSLEGLASTDGDGGFVLGDHPSQADVVNERALARACRSLGYPSSMAEFYSAALGSLGPLLRDDLSAQALMFPDEDMGTSLNKDERNLSNRYLHAAAAEVVAEAARSRPGPVRILELGGGAGGGTQAALAALENIDIDYLFTDVSRFFTTSADDRFGARTGFRAAVADIDARLTDQGIPANSFDVVLAANVLHCASDAEASFAGLREVLAPSGTAVVIEAVREHYLVLLTMQFLLSPRHGGIHPGQADRRNGSVFLSDADIRHYLSVNGLRLQMDLPGESTPLAAPSQRLFVGQAL